LSWACLGGDTNEDSAFQLSGPWHDRNKSGWWVLIAFVPVIGGLWYLIECGFLPGTTGANNYGADPLTAA
jgi:uncharacterized membrane protein YhaH (DUF805 family)